MLSATFSSLFAWSWSGHGALTTYAVAYAIARLIALGKSYLLTRIDTIYAHMKDCDDENVDGPAADDINNELPTPLVRSSEVTHTFYVFSTLPRRVQTEDIHVGNIPHAGGYLDSNGQVRHFMRSQPEISSWQAYLASKEYIRANTLEAWVHLSKAVNVKPPEGWMGKAHDWFFGRPDPIFFDTGLFHLAKALHAMEDSYAPGHVTRIDGLYWIKEVHIWDEENKEGDPSRAIPSHEEYDNPQHPKSYPFFLAAKEANGELIACVLGNLDKSEMDFRTDLDRVLARFLATCMPGD